MTFTTRDENSSFDPDADNAQKLNKNIINLLIWLVDLFQRSITYRRFQIVNRKRPFVCKNSIRFADLPAVTPIWKIFDGYNYTHLAYAHPQPGNFSTDYLQYESI